MLRLLGRSARGLLAPAALAVASATAVATCDGPAGATTGAPGVASAAPSGRAPSPADSAVAMPQRLVVMNSRAVRALSTHIRDKSSDTLTFATYADRLMTLLMEETLASLGGVTEADVATPCGTYAGLRALPRSDLAFVSIVRAGACGRAGVRAGRGRVGAAGAAGLGDFPERGRVGVVRLGCAGDSMLQAARALEPGVVVGKILIQRDEASVEKRAVVCARRVACARRSQPAPLTRAPACSWCTPSSRTTSLRRRWGPVEGDTVRRCHAQPPPRCSQVVLLDPMLASGGSAIRAIAVRTRCGRARWIRRCSPRMPRDVGYNE